MACRYNHLSNNVFHPFGEIVSMGLKLGDLTVMLVEPSGTQRKIVNNYLNNLGISAISEVDSGADALSQIQAYPPDLVISALYLPDMSGTDLVHAMRRDEALEDTAFMLISSETRFRYLDPIRQAGAIAILPKPFSQDDLKIALNTTLDFLDSENLQLENYDPENIEVLIVDDSPLARKFIQRVLSSMGLERFTEAGDGMEAMELIADNFYDLIVTDYNMPRMDGKELVEHIRSGSSQASVPVLMVTSEENENRLAAVQQAGISAVCDKPFEPESVRTLVEQALSEH
jgi:two-component system chemotaxis response regulator CheY